MKKRIIMSLAVCGALLCVGCSGKKAEKKETEAATKAAVETEAATDKTTSGEGEEAVSEAVSEAVEAVTEAVEAISEEAEEAAEDAIEELGERPSYKALDYVTLGEYTDLPVTIREIEISDEQVEEALKNAVQASGKLETLTEGTVMQGDIANIDYEGKKDDVAFDGGTAEGFDLTIGSGTFIPGFEEGLVDVKIGDTVDLDLTFPENYGNEELAGAAVVFTVKVNSVQRVPEITDELVGEVSGGSYSTVDGYKEYLREDLAKQAEDNRENSIKNELMTQLFNTCEVKEYPQDLIDYSIKEMKNYYMSYATSYGMEFGDFLQNFVGISEEEFMAQAEVAVKSSLEQEMILMAIAEQEGLTELSDEEYEQGCAEYAEQLGFSSVDEFKAAYDETRIRSSLALDAAMDFVREHALEVTEEETEAVTEGVAEEAEEAVTEGVTEAVTE